MKQKEEEIKKKYYADALNGKIKGVISTFSLYDGNNKKSPFEHGETVSVVGHSYIDNKNYFALYSPNGAGVYSSAYNDIFKGKDAVKLALLPSAFSDEVSSVIARQKAIADSLNAIKLDSLSKKLNEAREKLITLYKEGSPVLITDISWSSNSVGKITVDLNVKNCSLETIKYISFQGYFTNAVGDKCYNEIGGGSVWKARGIGPIGPMPTTLENYETRHATFEGSYEFDNTAFYSRTADTFYMSSVTIQYMNGKTVTLSGQNLKKHLSYSNPK